MAEYAGYVAPTPIDYGAISSGLLSNRLAVEKLKKSEASDALKLLQKQQAADEKARIQERKEQIEEEKLLREDLKSIETPEPTINKTYTDFVYNLAQSSREKIVELNKKKNKGEITSNQYLMAVNNITNGVKQYSDISKMYGGNLKELTDSITKNEQSPIGVFKIGKYANAGQYGNKLAQPASDDSGVLEYYTIDANGNKVKDQTIPNIDVLKSKDLFSDRIVDYNALFKAADESIGNYKKEIGATTIISKLKRDNIESFVARKANEIIPLDEDKARLLTVKLGYGIYSDDQEKQIALQQMYPIAEDREKAIKDGSADKKLIKYKLSDKGVWTSDLSDDQRATAVEYAKSDIKLRFEYSELKDEPKPMKLTVNVPKPTESTKQDDATLDTAIKDWDSIVAKGSASPAIRRIKKYYNNIYRDYGVNVSYVTKSGKITGIKVYPYKSDKTLEDNPTAELRGYEDMFGIYTPKNKAGGEYTGFDEAMKRRSGRYGNQ
jgi:hypothetical protein